MAPKNCILFLKAMGDGGHNTYRLRRVAFTGSTIRAPGRVDKIVVPMSLSIQMTSFFSPDSDIGPAQHSHTLQHSRHPPFSH